MAPTDSDVRLEVLNSGRLDVHDSTLSTTTSAVLSVAFTILYVLPFYLSPKTRPSPTLNRDAPSVIRARIRTVSLCVAISTCVTLYLLCSHAQLSVLAAIHHLGLWPVDPLTILKALFLTMLLFAGPLFDSVVVQQDFTPLASLHSRVESVLTSSQGYRNFVAGPLTEELLFRSSFVSLHLLASFSPTQIIFLTPLYFGIAHIHHFYEFTLTHPHSPLIAALLRSLFQFTFTSVFGWYASFVYLRTGNLYAVFLIHAFCNWMGLPRLWGWLSRNEPISPLTVRGKEDRDALGASGPNERLFLWYTIAYYVLLVFGAVTFWFTLFPLTACGDALVLFGDRVPSPLNS